jgi:hypothetical protein
MWTLRLFICMFTLNFMSYAFGELCLMFVDKCFMSYVCGQMFVIFCGLNYVC